mmetsp:Transcript_35745/g.72152  ORF Transcript_35745/g.72152 Transcript_35745/m.72152 type:complete len:104 (+) Transcript_35745:1-312(+)
MADTSDVLPYFGSWNTSLAATDPQRTLSEEMADDQASASELRRRYAHGGTAKDSELSSSQLRARYAVQNNQFAGGGDGSMAMIIGGIVIVAVIGAVFFFMQQQ